MQVRLFQFMKPSRTLSVDAGTNLASLLEANGIDFASLLATGQMAIRVNNESVEDPTNRLLNENDVVQVTKNIEGGVLIP